MRIFLNLFILSLLISCSSQVSVKKTTPIAFQFPSALDSIFVLAPELSQNFKINRKFIKDTVLNHHKMPLTIDQIKNLSKSLAKDTSFELSSFQLNEYYKIGKHKLDKSYEDFVSHLDIGQTKDAECYLLGKMIYGDSLALIIWKMDFSSYEACPYFSGSKFMATVVSQKQILKTYQIAGLESGADAPFSWEEYQEIIFSSKGIHKVRVEANSSNEETETIEKPINYKIQFTKKGLLKK